MLVGSTAIVPASVVPKVVVVPSVVLTGTVLVVPSVCDNVLGDDDVCTSVVAVEIPSTASSSFEKDRLKSSPQLQSFRNRIIDY